MSLIFDIRRSAAANNIHALSALTGPTGTTGDVGSTRTWYDATQTRVHRGGTVSNLSLSLQSAAIINGRVTLLTGVKSDVVPSVAQEVFTFSLGDSFENFNPSYSVSVEFLY